MKKLAIISLLLLPFFAIAQQKYKLDKQKIIGLSTLAFAGLVDGVVEGFEHGGRVAFERKYNADPYSFFGSQSYTKYETQPNIWNQNLGVWDFYHVGDDLRKLSYIGGGITIGIGEKRPFKHYLIDALLSIAVSSTTKRIGMYWIKN